MSHNSMDLPKKASIVHGAMGPPRLPIAPFRFIAGQASELISYLRRSLDVVKAGHEARRQFKELADDAICDAQTPPEDLLGLSTHQADLPFFMQPGYDRFGRD